MREILKDMPIEQFPSVEFTERISNEPFDSPAYDRKHIFVEDLPSPFPAATEEEQQGE